MAVEVRQTEAFARWLSRLRDLRARGVIVERIRRLELGHAGDTRSVGEGVFELRVHVGPAYRVYATERDRQLVVLLCGGDKGSQRRDIARAMELAKELEA